MGSKALLTDEIMPKLSLSKFPEIIEDYEKTFPDIEQFITQLDLKCLRFDKNSESLSKRLNEIRDNIVEQIVRMFDIDVLSVDSLDKFPTLKKFIDIVPAHSTILTLNYDLMLDQGLWLNGRWSPRGGYFMSSFPASNDENKGNILLLKLHGSCNFRNSPEYKEYPKIEINNNIFPNIHSYINTRNSSLDDGAHILVMSYLKIYHNGIMELWRKALDSLKDADRLTIIGCSLREEDTFLKFALYHFGMKENTERFKIDVMDIGEENCRRLGSKVKNLVARPDQQEINLYDTGLQGYLEKCQN
ncbi:MAG: hypothetical protein A2W05_06360 [Candidatus Schekmanbacteria bacterium RBG_16_38_10]|uniref:Uncharacterized protein n=1 Tax=Candidatus Schekmanbacteria bacterium RBG_16_38_10 TaxID=1817879 RepID=A0A1F7RVB3_9BACT|nr:MAG: hypothetical protein A2W05_06360 [Candidatus Schekmanbacteria bacterium RBG_16_38_10]